jgi:hypothetical protein
MNLLDHQMALEAKCLADYVRGYCSVHPYSDLGKELDELEAGELVSVFYLVAYKGIPLDYALLQYQLVTAMRLPSRGGGYYHVDNRTCFEEPSTAPCRPLTTSIQQEVVPIAGCEWRVTDRR